MMPKAEFFFDFGSPNAYLADKIIPDVEKRTGMTFDYVPILLGGVFKLTGNQSPVQAFGAIPKKLDYMRSETDRFLRRHAITTFKHNPHFPVNTLHLMRGAVAAQFEGVFRPYVTAVFHHMWEEPKKMDDPAIIREALLQSNLDADKLMARAQDADVKAKLMENTQNAVERGVFGAPFFIVGDELFFGKDQLRDVEDEILSQKAVAA